eukprot:scaffold37778_cov229-Amphora_coffeaeformis.AAC.2
MSMVPKNGGVNGEFVCLVSDYRKRKSNDEVDVTSEPCDKSQWKPPRFLTSANVSRPSPNPKRIAAHLQGTV